MTAGADGVSLTTARGLRLRPIREEDAGALHALWTAAAVRRHLWDDEVVPYERTLEAVGTSARLFAEHSFGLWGAYLPAGGDLIGFGGFWHFRDPPTLELLYGVAEPHWNRGHATDIGMRLVDYGFDVLGMPVIRASTDEPNAASVRVLQKLKFTPTLRIAMSGRVTLFYERENRPET